MSLKLYFSLLYNSYYATGNYHLHSLQHRRHLFIETVYNYSFFVAILREKKVFFSLEDESYIDLSFPVASSWGWHFPFCAVCQLLAVQTSISDEMGYSYIQDPHKINPYDIGNRPIFFIQHSLGQHWNASTTTGWVAMNLGYIHFPYWMNYDNDGPITFLLVNFFCNLVIILEMLPQLLIN